MKLLKKEKVGSRRILTICGMKFEYNTAKKYNFSEITESGVNTIPREKKIVVSLTSFPARIPTLYITVSSLLNQSMKPDKVVLYLAKEQFPNLENDLPENLLRLKEFGLSIRWCNDIRSYKKTMFIMTKSSLSFYINRMKKLLNTFTATELQKFF